MPDLAPSLHQSLGFLLNQAALHLRRETEKQLADLGLIPRELGILATLAHEDALTQRELGARLNLDRTSAMQLLNHLEAAGKVVRRSDRQDGRVYRLSITAAGRRTMLKAQAAADAATDQACAGLADAERQALAALLRKLLGIRD